MYEYLGTVFDKKLTFEGQVDAVWKKKKPMKKADVFTACIAVLRWLACLRKCFILAFTSWYGLLTLRNRNRLQGIMKGCSKISGSTPEAQLVLGPTRSLVLGTVCLHLGPTGLGTILFWLPLVFPIIHYNVLHFVCHLLYLPPLLSYAFIIFLNIIFFYFIFIVDIFFVFFCSLAPRQ